ncbi:MULTISPECIES: hypothetical protein [Streptomyces]|uniref:Hydrolase n=1 Tax=Streptomyces lycii TaxID=2654337 RepID=A0ABQ7FSA3_9ACTN|nr:hypothetical protein [Streptomyces lycii]KAF4411021.1 hypothetical protein GCU69_00740 [Streptomyces lycii]
MSESVTERHPDGEQRDPDTVPARAAGPPYADCVRCGEPTEYGAAEPGEVLCPVCEWQEAERQSCSG